MCADEAQDSLSRRQALQRMFVTSASAVVSTPIVSQAANPVLAPLCQGGSAVRPVHAYAPRFFTPSEIRALDSLVETVIPADDHSPGAKAAGVSKYIDYIVSNAKEETKEIWTRGLAAMDESAQRYAQKPFADCSPDQQTFLLGKISENEGKPGAPEFRFFITLKNATINGYYRSEIGIHQDLNYQGNTPLMEFPGCIHSEHAAS